MDYLWFVVAGLFFLILYLVFKPKPAPKAPAKPKRPAMKKGDYTLEELANYNGDQNRSVALAVKGIIYDVSPSDFYAPGGPYNLFAGKECARALAKSALDGTDLGSTDVSDLSMSEQETLEDWVQRFQFKYEVVGKVVGN
mmetsp:Transcript_24020/g.36496  ORF Transcript_24020/g.36496 Transcript_24020/m.36496 type:complete len:140 (-) Transcript_24020:24-443(-)